MSEQGATGTADISGAEPVPGSADAPAVAPKAAPARWRSVLGWICLVLAGVLLPLAVVSFWAENLVFDTDRYVTTVAPLADSPQVQNAIVVRATDAFNQQVDVQAVLQEALPPNLRVLSAVAASAVNAALEQVLRAAVSSDAFDQVWEDANRLAHAQVVGAFTGKGDQALAVEDGKVVIDVATLVSNTVDRLEGRFPFLANVPTDQINAEITLFQSQDLTRVQRLFDFVDQLGFWLPLLVIALLAAAIVLFPNHRRGAARAGVAVAIASAVGLLALAIGRQVYLSSLPGEVNRSVADEVWVVLLRFLRSGFWFLLIVGLVVAVVAWVAGNARARRFVGRYLRYVQGGVAVVFLLALAAGNNTTTTKVVVWLVVLAGVLITLELVGRKERATAPALAT